MLIGFLMYSMIVLVTGWLVWISILMLQWDDTSKWYLAPLSLAVSLIFISSGFWTDIAELFKQLEK